MRLKLRPLFAGAEDSQRLEIPLQKLATIDVKNGRLAWLGDLQPLAVEQVPYFDRLMPYRVNQSLTGGPLVLAEGPVLKGIAVHTKCRVELRHRRFSSNDFEPKSASNSRKERRAIRQYEFWGWQSALATNRLARGCPNRLPWT